MKKNSLILLFLVFALFYGFSDSIQTFRLDHLSLSDGLPNSSVAGILQDDDGFMWFGTQSGLTKYDGYSFKTYLNDPFDTNSIPHNLIQTMMLDDNDILWLGTYSGLSQLDINTDNFINYPSVEGEITSLSNDVVVAIERDHKGRLWVGTLRGLNLLDETTGKFRRFMEDEDDPNSLPDNTVRSIFRDENDNLWIGTYGGLSKWDEKNENFINFAPVENDLNSIPSIYVMTIEQSPFSKDVILLGSWGGGVAAFDTTTESAIRYEIPDMRVYTLLVDDENRVWAGTWGGGLSVLSLEDGSFNHFEQGSTSDLSHNIVYSLFQDLSGVIWIGTNGGGIDKYVDWKNQYKFYINDPENPKSLPSGKVVVAFEDSKSRLWFGVQGSGLSRLNKNEDTFVNYIHNEEDETTLSNELINTIFEDSNNNLWIGTNNGLNRYIEENDSFERYYADESEASLPDNLIYNIIEDKYNNLWIGTYTRGISVQDNITGEITYYRHEENDPTSLSDNLIRSLYLDSKGNVWISTNKGLNLFKEETKSFQRFLHDKNDRTSISNDDIRNVFEDSSGDLWIATNGGGVNLYNRETESFTLLSTLDGLLNNSVSGTEEDEMGNLLFITQSGISMYNKIEKSFTVIDEKTGLLSSELTSGYLKAKDGSFYIGSNTGLTHVPFFGEQYHTYNPMVHINKFSVLGIPYVNSTIPTWKMNEIVLKYDENILSFEFALSDYASAGQNQFAYKLEGVDSDWVYSGVRNFARYTQLDPGTYIFRVIGADSRNNWNNVGTSLEVTILPPFWLSTFAFILYSLVLILIMLLIVFRIRQKQYETLNKIEEQKALNIELENRVRKRTAQIEESRKIAENATKAKSLFLANMSHELRTPLNAVVGFSALLDESDYSAEKKHIISSIKAAGKTLSTLINDLLDLSKLEAGKMSIKYAPVNLSTVLFEIKHIFDLKVKEKKLELYIEEDENIPKELMMDETRFRQILINLTSNAIKFTNDGFVKIKISKIENKKEGFIDLKLSVEDSGAGINNIEKDKIFELFWQSDTTDMSKPTGTGLGLSITKNLVNLMNGEITVETQEGKGSIFSVLFHDVSVSVSDYIESRSTNIDLLENIVFKDIKALIVDDIEDNRNLLLEIMKKIRIQYAYAENGQEAISMAKTFNPDIIFMDLQMPVMDGFTASELLKSDPLTKIIPIVAVTASTETDFYDKDGKKTNYFSDYITKPYSLRNITAVLKNLLSFHSYNIPEEEMDTENFNIENIIDLEELLNELDELKTDWKELQASGRMSILENFAERLKDISKKHKARGLTVYAEDLLTYIKLFDLSNIEIQLSRFPSIIDKLKI